MIWKTGDDWEARYELAKQYYEAHGDLNISGDEVIQGVWMGKWLNEQKQIYWGRRPGKRLTKEQIQKLEAISFSWTNRSEQAWEEQFTEAKRYFEEHGNLQVPPGYVGRNGKKLDVWLMKQRQRERCGKMSRVQRAKMADIGFQRGME